MTTSRELSPRPDTGPGDGTRRRQPPRWVLAIAVMGGGLGLLGGGKMLHHYLTHEETENAQLEAHLYPLSSRVAGTVEVVAVQENQPIHRGDLLVKLDPREYAVRVAQVEAALATAQQQLAGSGETVNVAGASSRARQDAADGSVISARAALAEAQAVLARARAEAERDATEYRRLQRLADQGAVSVQQRDRALAANRVSTAAVQQARSGIGKAQAQLEAAQAAMNEARASRLQVRADQRQQQAARAHLAEARAQLQQARLDLDATLIRSPVDGRVGRRNVEVGKRLVPGEPLLSVIGDDIWVKANFKETQIARIHPGAVVEVRVDAFPERTFRGWVDSLSPASGARFSLLPPDNATGNFTKVVQLIPVKIRLDPASIAPVRSQLSPGLSVSVSVDHG